MCFGHPLPALSPAPLSPGPPPPTLLPRNSFWKFVSGICFDSVVGNLLRGFVLGVVSEICVEHLFGGKHVRKRNFKTVENPNVFDIGNLKHLQMQACLKTKP